MGDFYTGIVFPARFQGTLIYADFLQGWMKFAVIDDPQNIKRIDFATNMLPMSEIRQASDGSIVYASITEGAIRRIRYRHDPPASQVGGALSWTWFLCLAFAALLALSRYRHV